MAEGNNSQQSLLKFNSPQEEIAYLKLKLEETQTEFQEFQESSQELEVEYETQIKQLEKKNTETVNQLSRLEDENDQLRSRYNIYTNDTQHKLNEYQQQLAELTSMNDRLTNYIRELEQSNDDLERARRALAASLEDFEVQLNQQIERNVLLENEVSEKEELECVVQRLKEEARDLRHELIVNKNSSDPNRRKQLLMDNYLTQKDPSLLTDSLEETSINGKQDTPNTPVANGSIESRPPNVDSTTSPNNVQAPSHFSFPSPISFGRSSTSSKSTDTKSQQTSTPSSPTLPSITMTPSSRISALNIVTDLLRKVGALESKLASAKKVTC